ncbi:Uncharacterised protein [Chlamydia trachomatis]|nr:Uncharacterised protein [Chlamydia trachomatis]
MRAQNKTFSRRDAAVTFAIRNLAFICCSSLRTNSFISSNVECILHLPSWMIRTKIQGIEVEPFVFQLWAFSNIPSHTHEKITDVFHKYSERMARTTRAAFSWHSHIHTFFCKHCGLCSRIDPFLSFSQNSLDSFACSSHEFSSCGFICFIESFNQRIRMRNWSVISAVR